jgi:multidrug efflux pump subunit AcrB
MGCALCIFSIIGFVALSGIVVNNAILLVVFINRAVAEGLSLEAAVLASSRRRLRAILATSSTTALGLTPIMLETSFQARFLIPLVVSLAFGLLFSTLITLVLLPCLYLMRADLGALLRFVWTWKWERHAAARTIPEGNADSSATTKDGPPA